VINLNRSLRLGEIGSSPQPAERPSIPAEVG